MLSSESRGANVFAQTTKTRLVITVDTETYPINGRPLPLEANIYGNFGHESLGVGRIMDICDRFKVKATFFVDVYMHYHYGKLAVQELCQFIDARGHDVQLHAHTSWLPGSMSGSLHSFSFGKQVEIIREGRELIAEYTRKPPVAFRAGAYTASCDTIRALEWNNIYVDSSYFPFHKNCVLSQQLANRYGNGVFRIGNVFEVPVTTYWLLKTPWYRKIAKIDVNSSSLSEMESAILALLGNGTEYVILFLHSFSFIGWNKRFSDFAPNYRPMRRFEALLERLVNSGYGERFCTMADVARQLEAGALGSGDQIPSLNSSAVLARVLRRALG
jgi:hypothetical protein